MIVMENSFIVTGLEFMKIYSYLIIVMKLTEIS